MSQTRKQIFTRSSLACLSCRSRHQKCDAKKPQCSRCSEAARQCEYTRSRRGANGAREAALQRRRQVLGSLNGLDEYVSSLITPPDLDASAFADPAQHGAALLSPGMEMGSMPAMPLIAESIERSTQVTGSLHVQTDSLVGGYYKSFHRFHPLVVPRLQLAALFDDAAWKPRLEPLLAVIRVIGNLYFHREWSAELQATFEAAIEDSPEMDPIRVQCHLLYSAALFWQDQRSKSQCEMAKAVEIALQLRMFERDFASDNAAQNPTLAESWRRTWWMVYAFDAFYAGTLGTMEFSVQHIDATVYLPCEEMQYESGEIPEPRSLREWDSREFDQDGKPFSSFACLVGALRCASLAKAATIKAAAEQPDGDVFRAADSILDSWILLLPKAKKQILLRNGDVDELMFQAHLLIHVVIIGFHRPQSDLKANAVEDISSCARDPAPEVPTPEHINVHTIRVLRSVEAQISLLALPSRPFNHTPFCTCMISEGTLALLSACKFLLRGTELAIARDQIRLTIGCLKAVGDLWPRTARNVSQIQTIARHVLGLESSASNKATPPGTTGSRSSASATLDSSARAISSSSSDVFSSIKDFEDVCGWYDLDGLNSTLSW